ncbi:hypothetical protein A2291_01930 [candidate division WOR-1 bacterium RIFOXYB2_FULL_42_35]|uniref:PEP-CTERM sorting domain-containing protein n=1 Tax=candidate division WOR-1 bacterium RIFOXYC2_FULL_41_25 TaxID=1802586 RepID=A0A1F4TPW1_UNCSA|nr:MAG: hypothetical protein A2247_03730 [candidate division WOR-1 bacterium RIFOXYA2_FULL_41_14]OGC25162.1 MAG: hypothetical protein A2291_01930 [candidate division WOR-1 bacterium RIFOXYB2_FULL_42_35]OGC34718.1 MAG: hypothetical protein A2462_03245 [candidate division WOR-1 bacterium RIFOXYC2_FULL_41_25]
MKIKAFIGIVVFSIVLVSSTFAADIDQMSGKWGVGLFGTTPTVRMNFTDTVSTQIGLGYQSPDSNAAGSPPGIVNELFLVSFKAMTLGEGGNFSPVIITYWRTTERSLV